MTPLRKLTLLITMSVAAVAVADPAPKKGDSAKTEEKPAELPKAAPRQGETPVAPSDLPPFFGMFGSADLINKVGFRGGVGSYIEYRLDPKKAEAGAGHGLRLAQVGPDVPGARWIEMTAKGVGIEGSGLRILTRGNGKGNVERLIAQSPQSPPMELPLSGMSTSSPMGPAGVAGTSLLSDVKHLGHEKVEVPLGRFETEHWLVAEKPRLEIWTTRDEKVPFIGAVKMLTEEGYAVAAKSGTDAVGLIPAPDKPN